MATTKSAEMIGALKEFFQGARFKNKKQKITAKNDLNSCPMRISWDPDLWDSKATHPRSLEQDRSIQVALERLSSNDRSEKKTLPRGVEDREVEDLSGV